MHKEILMDGMVIVMTMIAINKLSKEKKEGDKCTINITEHNKKWQNKKWIIFGKEYEEPFTLES